MTAIFVVTECGLKSDCDILRVYLFLYELRTSILAKNVQVGRAGQLSSSSHSA
jgi:hypothetical protein